MENAIEERLDLLIGLYRLANATALDEARQRLRADEVVNALLDAAEEWVPTGALKAEVATSVRVSEKTVQRRIAELVEQKVLLATGSGASRSVKSSGLI